MTLTTKDQIINNINNSLRDKVERVFIIGTFLNKNWNPHRSDIDLICVDKSFEYFSYSINMKDIKKNLDKLNLAFDIFLYSQKQFNNKLKVDSKFRKDIENGMRLW